MSIFKSTQTAFNPKNNQSFPLWSFETNTMTVTYFNPEVLTKECKTYCTDFVRYHVLYSESHYQSRLNNLVNNGTLIQYLDELEHNVSAAISRQVEKWKLSDKEYQIAFLSGDLQKAAGLENSLVSMAREVVFESMVYI